MTLRWCSSRSHCCALPALAAEPNPLAKKAQDVLKAHCYRCHGDEGNVEGGMNYIIDLERLVARKKVVPGKPDQSPLFKRVAAGTMPPPDVKDRLSDADKAALKAWIDAGAPPLVAGPEARVRHAGPGERVDPRRPGEDRPPGPPVPALLHPHAPVQRRARPTTNCGPTATPCRS